MSVNFSVKPHFLRRIGLGIGLAVWVIVAFVAGELLTVLIAKAVGSIYPLESIKLVVLNTILNALAYILALLVTVAVPWLLWRKEVRLKHFGLVRLPDWPDLLLGPIAVVPYFLLSALMLAGVKAIVPGFSVDQAQSIGYSNLSDQGSMLLAFLMLVVIAPVVEEALFRGYLYGKLRKGLGLIASILLVSAAFAALHLPGANDSGAFQWQWNVATDVFALSIVLCILRETTGSIWAGILLHMTKNAIAFYVLFILPMMVH